MQQSRVKNLKQAKAGGFLCLHSIKVYGIGWRNQHNLLKLLRRLSCYAFSKIHLDRYSSFYKVFLILSWDINVNLSPVHRKSTWKLCTSVLWFCFSRHSFYYNLNSLSKNVSSSGCGVIKERTMYFIRAKLQIYPMYLSLEEVRLRQQKIFCQMAKKWTVMNE